MHLWQLPVTMLAISATWFGFMNLMEFGCREVDAVQHPLVTDYVDLAVDVLAKSDNSLWRDANLTYFS